MVTLTLELYSYWHLKICFALPRNRLINNDHPRCIKIWKLYQHRILTTEYGDYFLPTLSNLMLQSFHTVISVLSSQLTQSNPE